MFYETKFSSMENTRIIMFNTWFYGTDKYAYEASCFSPFCDNDMQVFLVARIFPQKCISNGDIHLTPISHHEHIVLRFGGFKHINDGIIQFCFGSGCFKNIFYSQID